MAELVMKYMYCILIKIYGEHVVSTLHFSSSGSLCYVRGVAGFRIGWLKAD